MGVLEESAYPIFKSDNRIHLARLIGHCAVLREREQLCYWQPLALHRQMSILSVFSSTSPLIAKQRSCLDLDLRLA